LNSVRGCEFKFSYENAPIEKLVRESLWWSNLTKDISIYSYTSIITHMFFYLRKKRQCLRHNSQAETVTWIYMIMMIILRGGVQFRIISHHGSTKFPFIVIWTLWYEKGGKVLLFSLGVLFVGVVSFTYVNSIPYHW